MPQRTIFGQASKLSRTMHDIRYDEIHDEFVVVNPFAEAILTFRGGADGQEGPIRIIQGPKTLRAEPTVWMSTRFTTRSSCLMATESGSIRAKRTVTSRPFALLRVRTRSLESAESLAVDPINNILVVGFNKSEESDPNGSDFDFQSHR